MTDPSVLKLEHSKHVKTLYWALVLLLFLVELILFRLAFSNYSEVGLAKSLWAFLISSTLPLGVLVRLILKVRPIVFAVYTVYPDQLNVQSGRRHMVIKYEDLYSVHFGVGWSRFFKGFQLKHQSGQSVRIFSTLDKSDVILDRINQLRPQFLSEKQLRSYRIQIQRTKISWQRFMELRFRLKLLAINGILPAIITSTLTWYYISPSDLTVLDFKWIDWFFGLLLLHLILILVLNTLEEQVLYLVYGAKVLEDDFQRNLDNEKVLRACGIAAYWALSGALLLALLQL